MRNLIIQTTVRSTVRTILSILVGVYAFFIVSCDGDGSRDEVELESPRLVAAAPQALQVGIATEISLVNNGGGSLSSCGASPSLPSGLAVHKSIDGNTCIISGIPTSVSRSVIYSVIAVNPTDADESTIRISVNEAPLCSDLQRTAVIDNPISRLSFEQGELYLAGDHSDWKPEEEYRFRYKGKFTGLDVHQVVVKMSAVVTGGEPVDSRFKIIAKDSELNTRYYVPADSISHLIATDPLEFNKPLRLLSGYREVDNNSITVIPGGSYLFTMALSGALERLPREEKSSREVGTLIIQACTPKALSVTDPGTVFPVLTDSTSSAIEPETINEMTISTSTDGGPADMTNTRSMSPDQNPKMTLSTDPATGVVTINVLKTPGIALFSTVFDSDPSAAAVRDFGYFNGGRIVFELNAPDGYGAYDTIDGMRVKIDHVLPGGVDFCDCEIPLDLTRSTDGKWREYSIEVDELVEKRGLKLGYVKTGLVLFPNPDIQRAQAPLTFKIRKAGWEPAAPILQNVNDQTFMVSRTIDDLYIPTSAGFIRAGGCRVEPGLPKGLELATDKDGKACIIAGTPASASTPVDYAITAINATGETKVELKIAVEESRVDLANIEQTLDLTVGLGIVPIKLINHGISVAAIDGCRGVDLPDGLSVNNYLDSHNIVSCQIVGTPKSLDESGDTITVIGVGGDTASRAKVKVRVFNIPDDPPSCAKSPGYIARVANDYPLNVGGFSNRLFVRGNHSNWRANPRFMFRHKGRDIYQAAAVFDGNDAVDSYNSLNTQFKIASDDENWTTQLYVLSQAATSHRDIEKSALPLNSVTRNVAVAENVGVYGNNLIQSTKDAGLLFTLSMGEVEGTGGVAIAGLRIDRCYDDRPPIIQLSDSGAVSNISATSATVHFTSSEQATVFILTLPATAAPPTDAEAIVDSLSATITNVAAEESLGIALTDLKSDTEYIVYVVGFDPDWNASEIVTDNFTTNNEMDSTAPLISDVRVGDVTYYGASLSFDSSEIAYIQYALFAVDEDVPTNIASLRTMRTKLIQTNIKMGNNVIAVHSLKPNTEYQIYLAAFDGAKNDTALLRLNSSFTTLNYPTEDP